MQRESNWRIVFIGIVVFLCLYFIYPTVRYIAFEFRRSEPRPTEFANDEAYESALAAYDEQKQSLQRASIKLGLDLVGGVDVLLGIDRERARAHILNAQQDALSRLLGQNLMIGISLTPNEESTGLNLRLTDPANARQAANALDEYMQSGVFRSYDRSRFLQTGEVQLILSDSFVEHRIAESIESAEKTVRERVDKFGVTQPSVSLQGSDSIRVQVPGEKDPEYVISQVIRPAQLEFYALHPNSDALEQQLFELATEVNERGEERQVYVLRPGAQLPPGYIGMPGDEVRQPAGPASRSIIPRMYVVRENPEMLGSSLQFAGVRIDPTQIGNPVEVNLVFDRAGADEFRDLSRRFLNQRVAIALDRKIYSAPEFTSIIPDGRARITGSFSREEAHDLALVLKAGAMPAELEPLQKRAIGPTLGSQSIRDSFQALGIAMACIMLFMIIYYATAGFIAILALILNILLIMACLNLFNATLTLSGIGGIILTIGMAVDANVLIYEGVREEIRAGREILAACRAGFAQAFSVIFDSNLTTLLTALVLLQFGEGSVQGFALTMCFGLIANLFTGLVVTYTFTSLWVRWRKRINVGIFHFFTNTKWDFIGKRRIAFALSLILFLTAATLVFIFPRPQYAVDFQGGVLTDIRLHQAAPDSDQTESIKRALESAGIRAEQARVQHVRAAETNDYMIRVALQDNPETASTRGDVNYTQQQIETALRQAYGSGELEILGTQSVSREVGQGFQQIAIFLVIASSIAILIYLWFRFELIFGMAAVVALIHDFIITVGILVLLRYQISLDIVSGLMILLGFSVNDTIVIFDRIRENSHTMFGKSFKEMCNDAMNRTLSRTIITSGTLLLVMVVMFFFGGISLRPFAMTMIIGSIVGTYSSDFIAAPLVFWWNERKKGQLKEALAQKGATAHSLDAEPAQAMAAAVVGAGTERRGRR